MDRSQIVTRLDNPEYQLAEFDQWTESISGKDFTKVEKVKDYEVRFYSEAKRKNFEVKISLEKTFKSMPNLTKDEAVKIGEHLMKSEKIAAYVDGRIKH